MFEKRKDSDSTEESVSGVPRPADAQQKDSYGVRSAAVIGSTISVKGQVSGDENLIIEGCVEGSVELSGHDLTIGQSGKIEASLSAKMVKVDGQVTGDITGSEKVVITKSGKVLGNIVAPRVTLEDGAKFKGAIDMDPAVGGSALATKPVRANSVSSGVSGKEMDKEKKARPGA